MPAPRPVRVCFLLDAYHPDFAGHAIQIQRSLASLRACGITATILTRRCEGAPGPGEEEEHPGVLRLLARGDSPIARARRILQLRRHFGRHFGRYDVVHSIIWDWEVYFNLPQLKRLGLPVVVEMVMLGGDDPLTQSRGKCGGLKMRLLRNVDAWVGIARAFGPRAEEAGIPPDRFRVIHTGVDVETCRPSDRSERRDLRRRLGIPGDARVAISIGSLIRRKGMDRVLRGWARMEPAAGRDLLLVVGPRGVTDGLPATEVRHAEELHALAHTLGISGTVHFTGRTEVLQDYLRSADVFLLLSRQEGLGTSILEAMSCGLPCVVGPVDGTSADVIRQGESGFIVEDPDDAAGVAACLARLLGDPASRNALGAAARRDAVERFSFGRRAAAYSELYREVLGAAYVPKPRA